MILNFLRTLEFSVPFITATCHRRDTHLTTHRGKALVAATAAAAHSGPKRTVAVGPPPPPPLHMGYYTSNDDSNPWTTNRFHGVHKHTPSGGERIETKY